MKTAYSYVRFSTPEQEMGDSERRQLALAQSYCTKSGLCLSETAFADRGVSAFHGKHREHNLIAHTSNRAGGRARLVCGGAGKGRSDCGFAGAPLDLIEKSFFSFLADADLVRPLLTAKSSHPCKLDELLRELAEAEKQAARIAELILGDNEPPKLLYERLKLEEACGRRLRSEIDAETMRLKAEAPALETYETFRETLANKFNDRPHRPELRRALAALLEKIVLDPHGKDGVWRFTVHLKGACEAVEIVCKATPKSRLPTEGPARLSEGAIAA